MIRMHIQLYNQTFLSSDTKSKPSKNSLTFNIASRCCISVKLRPDPPPPPSTPKETSSEKPSCIERLDMAIGCNYCARVPAVRKLCGVASGQYRVNVPLTPRSICNSTYLLHFRSNEYCNGLNDSCQRILRINVWSMFPENE